MKAKGKSFESMVIPEWRGVAMVGNGKETKKSIKNPMVARISKHKTSKGWGKGL